MRFSIFAITILFSVNNNASCQDSNIDSVFKSEMKNAHIAGLSVSAIENGKVVWNSSYGYQDIAKNIPVNNETIFMLASVSKTITAAAVMKLFSQNKIKLDDDINKYLPFKVINPYSPNVPITFRLLLRHKSSLLDNYDYLNQFWKINQGDPSIKLGQLLKEYLALNGSHYNKEKNFSKNKLGTEFSYSNIGYALLGYLVECISKVPYNEYCNEYIFKPLEMKNTGWYLKEVDSTKIAIPYAYSDSLQKFIPYRFGGYPDYPAGQLRTTISDLSHFLISWTQNGKWEGKAVFDSASIQTLTPNDFSLGWHTWYMYILDTEHIVYSHAGGDNGISTYMLYGNNMGIIILTNSEMYDYFVWRKLIDIVYKTKLKH